jgi:hypothetical protein
MGNFYKDSSFEDICSQHTHVVSAEGLAEAIVSAGTKRQAHATSDARRPA